MHRLLKAPFTLLIHIALAIIVAGAFVTHFYGIQGSVSLIEGTGPVNRFEKSSGPGDGSLPFALSLEQAETLYYPGTTTPMDFRSRLKAGNDTFSVAMNRVAEINGWRFYQSGMGEGTSTLSVTYDPWGIGITYTGYILLGIGMVGFFFQRKTIWRSLLRSKALTVLVFLLLPCLSHGTEADGLNAMQRPLARNFGKIHVYWNGRVCPLQTMAIDVTTKLYDSRKYKGMTPEQVLSGWLFYYDEWKRDYDAGHTIPASPSKLKKEEERRAIINWLGTGAAFRIFPYHAATGRMEWLSLTGRRPSQMSLDQWIFMQTSIADIQALIMHGSNIEADRHISALIEKQREYVGTGVLPSPGKFKAEIFYNDYIRILPCAILLLIAGGIGLWYSLRKTNPIDTSNTRHRLFKFPWLEICAIVGSIYLCGTLALRGWIGSHWPLSNGCETMLSMAFAATAGAIFIRQPLIKSALIMVGAMGTFVAAMAGKTPQIESLTPVLASPLLSIHVMLVMCSYALFLLMAILSGIALVRGKTMCYQLARINAIILLPAVFLLCAGIFVGAVWANQSWGRYWGWDPKETCALVTLLVYALPLHRASLRWTRRPRTLHWYLLLAISTVLFTYFGANYLLPGLHSYA